MKFVHILLLASLAAVPGCDSDTNEPIVTSIAETFASRLQENGSAWRSVNVTKAGDVTIQLVTVTQVDAKLNLGIGTISGTQCVLAASVDTVANAAEIAPRLVRTVSTGTYCVRIADIGNLTQLVDFSIRIEKPF